MGAVNKTILVLSGGKEAIEGIRIAKGMGLKVIVCDGDRNAPGRALADEFLHVNFYDPGAVESALSKYRGKKKINGVITIASDAVRGVAAAVESLGLPGISKGTAFLATEKLEMKKRFKAASVPVPHFVGIDSKNKLKRQIGILGQAVLKPVDSRGARGVLRVDEKTDIDWAFDYSIHFSPSKKLILEEWVPGPQISTESLVVDGKTYLCGVADRNYSRLDETFPYVVEDGGETPSRYSPVIDQKLTKLLDSAAKALALRNGVIKGDIVLRDGEPLIIEVAARLSGGFFSTFTIPLVYKINIVEQAILLALGERVVPPLILKAHCHQANRFLFVGPGTVKKVTFPRPGSLPGFVKYFEVNVFEGDVISRLENHTMRKGSVLVIGKSREQAVERAERMVRSIKVETNCKGG